MITKFLREETTEILDPETAAKWLGSSQGNRGLRKYTIDKMTRDILSEAWQDQIADAIHFDVQGHLRNGHHRCHSVIQASRPILTRVIWGCSEEEIAAIDGGIPRTLSDKFAMDKHVKHATSVAATVRWLYQYARGGPLQVSTAEGNLILARHPEVVESATAAHGIPIIGSGMPGAIHFTGVHVHQEREKADQYLNTLRTGVPAYDGDPVHMLRERLIKMRSRGITMITSDKARAMAHAWNLFRIGFKAKQFKIPEEVVLTGLTVEFLVGNHREAKLIKSPKAEPKAENNKLTRIK